MERSFGRNMFNDWTPRDIRNQLIYRTILLLVLFGLVKIYSDFRPDLIVQFLPRFFEGLWMTLQLTCLALFFGFLIALPLAMIRARPNRGWGARFADGYVFVFRGSPLLVQLYIIYFGFSQFEFVRDSFLWPIFRDAYWCALIAFSLNSGAYACEILRGSLVTGAKGEREAAQALGMSPRQVDWLIWVPAALRRALPQYGNEVVFMLHGSAIASLITITDILGAGREMNARLYTIYEGFFTAALFYMVVTFAFVTIFRLIEKRYLSYLNM